MSKISRSLYLIVATLIVMTSPSYAQGPWRDISPGGTTTGGNTPPVTMSPEGEIRLQGKTTPEAIEELRDMLGLPSGGYFGPDVICGSLMSQLPSGLIQGAADIGSLFGLCPSSSEFLKEAIEAYHERAGRLCASFSGMQLSGKPKPTGIEIWDCTYTAPKIEPDCDEIEKFCKKEIQPELFLHDQSTRESLIGGSAKFPGCSCNVTTFTWLEISLLPIISKETSR